MLDIIIVNWNSGGYLLKCVQSILQNSNEQIVKSIWIIDNHSSDNSISVLPSHPKIVIVENKVNLGFSKACNQGFKLCTSSYVLLLNPDVQLFGSTLSDCISYMDDHYEIDIMGCQLHNDDGSVAHSCARFPTPLRYFYDTIGLSKMAPKIFTPALLMSDWDHKTSRFVDQVMGAFMFMRFSVFEKLGYFDERFFVYCEELDFSKRLADQGGKSYFNANISAIHSGGGTTNSVKAYRLFLNLRSRLQYSKKHFSYFGYVAVSCCTFFIEPLTRIFFLLLKRNADEIKEVVKGYKLLLLKGKTIAPDAKDYP